MTVLNKPNTQTGDFLLEVALGNVAGYIGVNKFGHAPDCDSGVDTDIWDGADGVTSTDLWVAPTIARIHALVSSSTADKGTPTAGTGMRSVMIHGLTSWTDTKETREMVTLNGTSSVNTVNAYVIIYRLMGMTFGSGKTNAGIVKATAATDSTITALIQIGKGQTQMAIWGIPAESRFVISHIQMDMLSNSSASAIGRILVETMVDMADSGLRLQREWNVRRDSRFDALIQPPIMIAGPAILKLQVTTDTASVPVTGSFDGLCALTDHPEHAVT